MEEVVSSNSKDIKMPLVSIIMPLYNSKMYVKNSILSVINQTYSNWELLVIDDCSTDNSLQTVKEFNDDRIIIISNEVNSGAAVSRNVGIEHASGKYVAFLDSDDQWTKDKLELQVKFMEEKGIYFSYTRYEEYDVKSGKRYAVSGPKKINKRKLNQTNWPGCLTVMYNQEKVGKVSIIPLRKRNDYALWLKIIKVVDCYLLDKSLAIYTCRSGTISSMSKMEKIRWYQKVFHLSENRSSFVAWIKGFKSSFYYVIKRILYKRKIKQPK